SLTHHERWDGSGYPIGLKGEEIPISGQIVGVADSFDAMISKRPYKRAKSFDEAFREIEENSGTLYSPQVVKAFLESVEEVISIYRGDKYNNNFNDNFEKN
ncbi:MAG: two-component system response regulator, partial [Thermotogaceae bacterium]|nr:two-component system response regulator [Thermotogaceae bacterium]